MSPHPSVSDLSAYLDEELTSSRRQEVERHLSECSTCRGELTGLRKVVTELGRLERAAPPPALGHRLRRRLATEDRPVGLAERLDARFSQYSLDSPLVFTFALVLALGVLVYSFAHWSARDPSLTPVVLESEITEPLDESHGFIWEGRSFVFVDDVWRDQDCLGLSPETVITIGSPEWEELLVSHPEMKTLVGMAEPVVVEIDGAVVRLERGGDELRIEN